MRRLATIGFLLLIGAAALAYFDSRQLPRLEGKQPAHYRYVDNGVERIGVEFK